MVFQYHLSKLKEYLIYDSNKNCKIFLYFNIFINNVNMVINYVIDVKIIFVTQLFEIF